MPSKGFVLSFTGLPSTTRTTIASRTGQELEQRGYNIEPLAGQPSASNEAIVLAAVKSDVPQTLEDLRGDVEAFVEVEIGIPTGEQDDASRNLKKIFLPPDAEPESSVADILAKLEGLELIAAPMSENSSYDEEDEAMIRSRLEALGYL